MLRTALLFRKLETGIVSHFVFSGSRRYRTFTLSWLASRAAVHFAAPPGSAFKQAV
jgi:hypothetical protein